MTNGRTSLFSCVDLFAGPGGWDHGIEPLGIRALGIEWDEAACTTREACGLATLRADVSELHPKDFEAELLIGSPPCQAFSVAGKGDGHKDVPLILTAARALCDGEDIRADLRPRCADERALLVVEPLRWALALKPRWIALEQVPPVLQLWRHFADLLSQHGYECWGGVLSSERYGVPQTRERAFLMASLVETPHPPLATHQAYEYGVPASEQHTLEGSLEPWISMAEALGLGFTERPVGTITAGGSRQGGPDPLDGGGGARATIKREREAGRWYDRRQGNTNPDGSRTMVRLIPDTEPAPTIGAAGLATGRDVWVQRERSGERAEEGFDPAEMPSQTLTSKARSWTVHRPATTIAGDPRVFQPGGHHEPGQQSQNATRVTLQEAAILQGFPPDYPFQGKRTKQFEQVGNAIPPPLARAVVEALLGSELARRSEAVAA